MYKVALNVSLLKSTTPYLLWPSVKKWRAFLYKEIKALKIIGAHEHPGKSAQNAD